MMRVRRGDGPGHGPPRTDRLTDNTPRDILYRHVIDRVIVVEIANIAEIRQNPAKVISRVVRTKNPSSWCRDPSRLPTSSTLSVPVCQDASAILKVLTREEYSETAVSLWKGLLKRKSRSFFPVSPRWRSAAS